MEELKAQSLCTLLAFGIALVFALLFGIYFVYQIQQIAPVFLLRLLFAMV